MICRKKISVKKIISSAAYAGEQGTGPRGWCHTNGNATWGFCGDSCSSYQLKVSENLMVAKINVVPSCRE